MNNAKTEKEILDKINSRTGQKLRSLRDSDENGWNALMHGLANNKEGYLNLSKEQINYLFKNSNIKRHGITGETALDLAIIHNKTQELALDDDQWDYLIRRSSLAIEQLKEAIKYNETTAVKIIVELLSKAGQEGREEREKTTQEEQINQSQAQGRERQETDFGISMDTETELIELITLEEAMIPEKTAGICGE